MCLHLSWTRWDTGDCEERTHRLYSMYEIDHQEGRLCIAHNNHWADNEIKAEVIKVVQLHQVFPGLGSLDLLDMLILLLYPRFGGKIPKRLTDQL